jgi:hypothetical protein
MLSPRKRREAEKGKLRIGKGGGKIANRKSSLVDERAKLEISKLVLTG